MAYVDGFVLAVRKKNLKAYVAMARRAGKIWREYGCLDYRECVGDDLASPMLSFTRLARLKRGETAVFSWIAYKSKAHRDSVNRKIMKDPRIAAMMKDKPPFDAKRMAYGGFRVAVDNP